MSISSLDARRVEAALDGVREAILLRDRPTVIARTRDVLHALGWGEMPHTGVQTIDHDGAAADLACTFSRTPVFFVRLLADERRRLDEIAQTLQYTYNRAKDWALSVSSTEAAFYNVLWQSRIDEPDRPFRSVPYQTVRDRLDDLWLLTPPSFERGVIQEQAELEAPTPRKMPIAEKLLADLSEARLYLLELARGQGSDLAAVDESINRLLARLIFLRTAEDRGWPVVRPLREVVNEDAPHRALGQLFQEAAQVYDAGLFEERLPLDVWGPGVRKLVTALLGAPDYGVEYDFGLIDVDLLGQTYERYLSAGPSEGLEGLQLSLAGLGSYPLSQVRRLHGVYYTPAPIVDYMVDRAFQDYFSDENGPSEIPSVLDLSCGSGGFLVSAFRALRERLPSVDARLLVDTIFGADVDPRAVLLTRLNLWLSLEGLRPLPNLERNIVPAEALMGLPLGVGPFPDRFDIVIGNPPYRRIDDFPETPAAVALREEIEERFESATGRYDMSALFIERALSILKPGGIGCMIVPNRLLTSRAARPLRRLLGEGSELLEILDFTSQRVFPGVGSYTAIVVFRKTVAPRRGKVKVARVRSVGSFLERTLAVVRTEERFHDEFLDIDTVQVPAGGDPWHLMTSLDAALVSPLKERGVPLSEVADLYQGVKTGANHVFLLRRVGSGPTKDLVKVSGTGGKAVVIETAMLRRAVRRGIGYYLIRYKDELVIYPYRNGKPLPEAVLRDEYPHCWEYLSTHRRVLEERSTVRRGDTAWYELAWPREEEWLSAPKILVPSMGLAGQFGVDWRGEFVPVGPTAIVPRDMDIWILAAVLNSPITFRYLSLISHQFRGGYVDFKQRYLEHILVPAVLLRGQVSNGGTFQNLCEQVRDLVRDPELSASAKLVRLKQLESLLTDRLSDMFGLPSELRERVLAASSH